jgi:hypothetical protein
LFQEANYLDIFWRQTRTSEVNSSFKRLRLDRSTARYIYKAKIGKLNPSQKTKLIFELFIQTLFNKDLF